MEMAEITGIVGNIAKPGKPEIVLRVEIKEYMNHPYLDIRIVENGVPTTKGFPVSSVMVGSLIDALVIARRRLNENNHSDSPY
jgi:hypothetical protein